MDNGHRGARVGPRIAHVVSQSLVATHQALLSTRHKLAMSIFHAASDEISEEAQHVLGPVLKALLADPDLDKSVKPHIEFLAYQHGQLAALAGSSLAASGLASSLALIINDALAPTVYGIVGKSPNLLPDPVLIAKMIAQGIGDRGSLYAAIRGQGFSDTWGSNLAESAFSYPDTSTSLEMYRRGFISEAQLTKAMERNGTPGEFISAVKRLTETPLSPADAALAVLRGNMSQGEGQHIASLTGVSHADFQTLINNTGEPIGLMQLLEAYRRGFIGKDRLDKGIRQSRVRDEWIDVAEKLRYTPMNTADAVQAVVQNQISDSQGARIAEENGLEPGHWRILVNRAGEPLSRTEMEQLYNRGLVGKGEVEQALRESRLKNKYVGHAFELHRRIIPVRTAAALLRSGALSHQRALRAALDDGYSPEDAAALMSSSTADKLAKYRDKVMSAVETMYADGAITRDRATSVIKGLGHSEKEAEFILQAAEFHRDAHLVSQGVSAIRSKFVAHHITEHEASADLTALGVIAEYRDRLLHTWTIERSANVKTLTSAQILKAHRLKLIDDTDAADRLLALGYNAGDAALLLAGA